MAWRIGVDSGSIFIGVCLFDGGTGRVDVWKIPATPDDPVRGVAQAIEDAIAATAAPEAEAAARPSMRNVRPDPLTGMVAAREAGRLAGLGSLISFDMGGSSTAIARLAAGEAAAPVPDVHSVPAGGGSIASAEAGGRLQVGPRSAGADPGPACAGGGEPTLTDAHVVLGTLNPDHLLGGRLPLRQDLAREAVGALAARLGLELLPAAQAIVATVTASLAQAVPPGDNPGQDTLVAFGGAGPLHAARLARERGIPRILVPRHAGLLGALGKLLTDLRADFFATRPMDLEPAALPAIAEAFGLLRHRAAVWFSEEKIPAGERRLSRSVDIRLAGQTETVAVALPEGPVTAATLEALAAGFAASWQPRHGAMAAGARLQLVAFRVEAVGLVARPTFPLRADAGPDAAAARQGSREVWLPEAGGWLACPVYDRARLDAGNRFSGPAIVEQMDATTLILPGMTARVDPYLNLLLGWDG